MPNVPDEKPNNKHNKLGLHFKPWPLPEFLTSVLGVAILFVLESFLPKGMISYASLIGGSMAGVTMAYLSYCGYSVWTSPPRMRMALVMIFFGVLTLTSGVAGLLLAPRV